LRRFRIRLAHLSRLAVGQFLDPQLFVLKVGDLSDRSAFLTDGEDEYQETDGESFVAHPFVIAYTFACLNCNAFPITETELNVIAALAIMGLRSKPATG
jgi:hypothetical protein